MNLKLQKLSKVSMAFLMALFSIWGYGQNDIYWNATTAAANSTPSTPNYTVGSFSQNNNNGTTTLVNTGSASSGYNFTLNTVSTAASGTGNFGAAARTGSLSTSQSAYFEVTITPTTGYVLSIASLNFASRSTGTGPASYSIQTNASGSFAQALTGTLSTSSNWQYKSNTLSLTSSNAITLRIYGYGGTGTPSAGTANWRIDDLVINASASLLPTTWNGTSWSNGDPTASLDAIINGDYNGVSFTANTLTINSSRTLTINSGQTVTTGNATNNGNIIVNDGGNFIQTVGSTYTSTTGASFVANRNSSSVADKYVFWSSPVVDQNIFTAYTSGSSATAPTYVMTYNTGTNFYDLVTNTDSNFVANSGKGYSVKVPQTNAGLLFGGTNKTPNNGTVNVALAGTAGSLNNFNLIGNPYPSNLDLSAFYTANSTAIGSTFWFWDNTVSPVTTQTGSTATNVGYATVNLANSAGSTWVEASGTQSPSNSTASLNAVGNIAKTGQAFIVKSVDAGQVSFTNAMRSSATGVTLNKNGDANAGKFWVKLTTSYGNTATQAITYSQNASNAYDVYDSKAMGMGSDAFYSLAGAEKVIIQGRAPFNINDVVPLGAKHFENGNFTVSLSHKEGLFTNGQAIYLHDKSTGTYTNLQNQAYSFAANAGEFANRFEIVYKLDVLATSEVQKDAFEIYRDGEDFFVRNNKNIENIEIFDTTGRKIQTIESNSKLVRIKLESTGVYIIKAKSAGKEYSKKVIK